MTHIENNLVINNKITLTLEDIQHLIRNPILFFNDNSHPFLKAIFDNKTFLKCICQQAFLKSNLLISSILYILMFDSPIQLNENNADAVEDDVDKELTTFLVSFVSLRNQNKIYKFLLSANAIPLIRRVAIQLYDQRFVEDVLLKFISTRLKFVSIIH